MLANPQESLQSAAFDVEQILLALEHDPEMWIQFTLAPYLTVPTPPFHIVGFQHLVNMNAPQTALAWPRGHAKTTICKAAVVWHWAFTRVRFCVYGSNTSPIAKQACVDIINIVKSDNFTAVFGEVEWLTEAESAGLWKFVLFPDDPHKRKVCILRSWGTEQQVRGMNIDNMRPELLVCDDIEDDDNTSTKEQRQKLTKKVHGQLFKALAIGWNKKIWLGNMLDENSELAYICEDPNWNSIKYGCIIEDPATHEPVPLWPDVWPMTAIRADFLVYQRKRILATWYAEMMNIIVTGGKKLIEQEDISYAPMPVPGQQDYGFITIDPSISEKTWADDLAVVVHVYHSGRWVIPEVVAGQLGIEKAYYAAIDLAFKWGINLIGIETIAYQAALKWIFEYLNRVKGFNDIQVVGLTSQSQKAMRIAGWCILLKTGEYALVEGDMVVTQQLLSYNPGKKDNRDDIIDAAAYGEQMIAEHMDKILESKGVIGHTGKTVGSYESAAI